MSELNNLDGLKERCEAAPRYGKNAKALLLETLCTDHTEYEFRETTLGCSPPQQTRGDSPDSAPFTTGPPLRDTAVTIADVLELFKCVPPLERHYVQYSITQKFPKIKRQTEVNTLTGKYLELLLKRTNLRSKEQWLEEIKQNEGLRLAAVSAADKNERLIYRESYRLVDYLERIRGEKASERFLDVRWREQWEHQDDSALPRIESTNSSYDDICVKQLLSSKEEATAENSTSSEQQDKPSGGEPNAERPRLETVNEEPGKEQSVNDFVPDDDKREAQSQAVTEVVATSKGVDSGVSSEMAPALAFESKQHKTCTAPSDKQSKVQAFVKRILDPHYAAQLIDREAYKAITRKATQKILAVHTEDRNVDFLVNEYKKIRRLTHEYIKYYRKKSSSSTTTKPAS